MNTTNISINLISLCFILASQFLAANEISFAFNPDSAESIDHIVIPFPEENEITEEGLSFSIQSSNNLIDWETIQTIHFELVDNAVIKSSLLTSAFRFNEAGLSEQVWRKHENIYPHADFYFAVGMIALAPPRSGTAFTSYAFKYTEALSYVSQDTKEIYVFIGEFDLSWANFTLIEENAYEVEYAIEYTSRVNHQFFRMVPEILTFDEE